MAGSLGIAGHPERVAEEYQRRLQAPTSGTRQAQATLETQIGKVRQGVARLIDSYAEGLLESTSLSPVLRAYDNGSPLWESNANSSSTRRLSRPSFV